MLGACIFGGSEERSGTTKYDEKIRMADLSCLLFPGEKTESSFKNSSVFSACKFPPRNSSFPENFTIFQHELFVWCYLCGGVCRLSGVGSSCKDGLSYASLRRFFCFLNEEKEQNIST